MFSRLKPKDVDFYVNSTQVHAVQEIKASYDLPVDHIKFLGMNSSYFTPDKNALLSITSLLNSSNSFLNFTGDSGVYGFLMKKSQGTVSSQSLYGFNSGYMTNYTLSCQVGDVPRVQTDFIVLTDAGGIQPFGTFNQTPVPALANSNSIEVSIGSVKINRISSLSLSLSIPRLPIYYLGNVVPSFVKSIYPIQLECSFVLQQDQYNLQSLSVLPFNFNDESAFSIRLNDVNGIPVNFDFNNKLSYLVNESENFSAAVGNPLGVTVRYKGFLK